MHRPAISYARSGDVFVAYQVFGSGLVDLVVVPGFLSNIDYGWEFESWRHYYGALASFARVVLFDKRGTGVSDPLPGAPSAEERMDDIRAVMDAVHSERAALLGAGDGAAMAALFAATYPERTAATILYSPIVRGRWAPDYPWGMRDEAPSPATLAGGWGEPRQVESGIAEEVPGRVGDGVFSELVASYMRLSASPTTAARMIELILALDVRDALSAIRAPTLVVHHDLAREPNAGSAPTDFTALPTGASRYVADRIPGARYVELTPGDPVPWALDPTEPVSVFGAFLSEAWEAGAWEPAEPDRVLATLLFSDIVASTQHVAELGDARWRDLVHQHHALVRQQLVRYRGREIDTAGDGFFASFDGPARAVRCAAEIVAAVRELGIDVRVGVHTGECEVIDGKPGGLAVVVASRIASAALPGAVLTSSTVKDLVAGSRIVFEDRGEHELKGVPGAWVLHAVVDANVS